MKLSFRPFNNRAFTAIELAVVVAGLSLPAMLLPALGKAKAEANRIKCTNNLRSVDTGHLSFAQDNNRTHALASDTHSIEKSSICRSFPDSQY